MKLVQHPENRAWRLIAELLCDEEGHLHCQEANPEFPPDWSDRPGRIGGGNIGPARRSLPCECRPAPNGGPPIPGERDPHPGGWCRFCGRVIKRGGHK